MSIKKIISFLLIFLILICVASEGYAENKDRKQKKDKDKTEQQKPAPSLSQLIDAKKYEITGDTEKAEETYRQFMNRYPDVATTYFELSRILASKKQFSEAVEYSRKSVSLDPDNPWYKIYLAELQQILGNYKESTRLYNEIIEKDPDNMDHYYQLAALYLSADEYVEAVKTYDRIEKKIGITEDISLQKERIYLGIKENAKAEKEIEALVAAYPDEPRYLAILAELYLSTGKQDKALELYKKIAEVDPNNPYIHMSMADYYRKTGNREKAFEELKLGFANPELGIDDKINILLSFYTINQLISDLKDEAFILSKILIETHPNEPKAHSVYADLLIQDKQNEKAREELMKVISLDSSRYAVWEEVMQLDLQMEKYDDAISLGKTAKELFPEKPGPYLMCGAAWYQKKENEKAIKEFKTGTKLVVGNDKLLSTFYMYLGDSYHAINDAEESYTWYEKALALDPENAYVLNNYSYYLSLTGRELEKAEKMSKKSLTVEPDNTSFQDTYGWILFKLGKYEDAKTWVDKSIRGDESPSGEVLEHYGDILYKLGDTSQALEYWIKAKAKGPGSEKLDRKIELKKLIE
jgi:tetratricopeptide (TPR) repeat protein